MPEKILPTNLITAKEVGRLFLNHYIRRGYQEMPGSSLLDDSVPMSFVMSAGMVQFERLSETSRSGDHYVLIQNCFRYFDLAQIGSSHIHLSLFQMPGAFDFGPVDRKKTIVQIWDLLLNVYRFDPASLYVTYFSGDTINGQELPADSETALAWRLAGIPHDHIIGLSSKCNYWMQTKNAVGKRNSRKRGPNTEVFFDRGVEYACGSQCFPGCACGRFIEFLNTLFITHGVDENKDWLAPLDEPFTEVVIGLERVAAILQGVGSVFEVDSIYPLIQQVRCFSKPRPVELQGFESLKLERTLVDHLRALLFLTADGAPPPGRGGRARLMRILTRELLASQRLLGISDSGFMRSMILEAQKYQPDISPAQTSLLEYVALESRRFERTVREGFKKLKANSIKKDQLLDEKEVTEHGLLPLVKYRRWQVSHSLENMPRV